MTGAPGRIIDADFRGQEVDLSVVAPYLSPDWRGYLRLSRDGQSLPGTRVKIPETVYWNRQYDRWRPLVGDPDPDQPAEVDHRACAQQYFREFGVASAVFNPGLAGGLSATGNSDYANAVARAVNDWLVAEWIERDDRILGTITTTLKDPIAAAAEIRRLGDHERMAQVIVAHPPRLLGDRALDPVWEAAQEYGLPVALEAAGAFAGVNPGLTTAGHPASRFEYEASWIHGAQPHLLNMISQGVFDRFPDLRLILNGFGAAWLPSLIWRLQAELRRCPDESLSPLTGLPEDYVRRHVRVTTGRLDLPDDGTRLIELLSLIDGADLLMLSSGPLGGIREMQALLDVLPIDWRRRVAHDNAAATFRPTHMAHGSHEPGAAGVSSS
jgi:predicted TIM-barrel fold metal-dependent hydrolase